MESVPLPNWEAFTGEVQKLREQLPPNASGKPPELLFRGQSDSSWPLKTTLERMDCEGMSFGDYYRLTVHRVRPTVEALTGTTWDVPDFDVSMEQAFLTDRELFSLHRFPSVSFYRDMVYLRHHGFPSPLLDWTSSANIAAFFAFRGPSSVERRSIYVYCERPHGIKGGAVGEPAMRTVGKYVRTHARHFRQQSDYTVLPLMRRRGLAFSSA
jgi:FRG domain